MIFSVSFKSMKKTFLNRHKISVILAFSLGAAFFGATLFFVRKYQSKTELLVIQKQNNWRIDDAYSAAKSAESISSILAHIIETTSFLDRVMNSGYSLDKSILKSADLEERKKDWDEMVEVKTVKNSGVIRLKVFHKEKEQAENFASAIAYVLSQKSDQYHGGGDRVEIKLVDGPITSFRTVAPIAIVNLILGILLGLGIGYLFERKSKVETISNRFNLANSLTKGMPGTGGAELGSSFAPSFRNSGPPENLPGV
ncbi:MAG: hypothetical protein V1698_00955 [bacterium]